MKTILVLLAVLGAASAAPRPKTIADEIGDFLDLLPLDEIDEIVEEHLKEDGALAGAIAVFQSDEWRRLVHSVSDSRSVEDFFRFLERAGLPIEELFAYLYDLVEGARPAVRPAGERSLKPLLDDLVAVIPADDLAALLEDKLKNDPEIQDLYTILSSERDRLLLEQLRDITEVQELLNSLRRLGVPLDEVLQSIYVFFGWRRP